MKKIIALVLAVLTLVTALSFAGCGKKEETPETRKFIMGIDPEYPPFSFMDKNGEYTGFDVEVCKAACDYLGWDFEVFAVTGITSLFSLMQTNVTVYGRV